MLGLAAQGDTVEEISRRLHLSTGTVRNYLSAVITKTGARNRFGRDPDRAQVRLARLSRYPTGPAGLRAAEPGQPKERSYWQLSAGALLVPFQVPVNPNEVDCPAPRVPL